MCIHHANQDVKSMQFKTSNEENLVTIDIFEELSMPNTVKKLFLNIQNVTKKKVENRNSNESPRLLLEDLTHEECHSITGLYTDQIQQVYSLLIKVSSFILFLIIL